VGKLDRNYSNTGSKLKAADNFAILYIQVCAERENSYSARPNRSDAVERGTRSRSRNGGSFSGKSLITQNWGKSSRHDGKERRRVALGARRSGPPADLFYSRKIRPRWTGAAETVQSLWGDFFLVLGAVCVCPGLSLPSW
jgi:hypothetical protein